MNLPFLKTNKGPEKGYFFALLIKPFTVGAILFEEEHGALVILSSKEINSDKEVDKLSAEELLVLSDKAISSVEPSSPSDVTVEKTIFSVPYNWVEEGKIKHDYLAKLKKLCEDLGLVPMGYLMSIEAIVHQLQRKEGAPISAIFVEAYESKIFLYLVKGGKINKFLESDIEEGAIATTEKLLKSIDDVDVFPSKIVLLNHEGEANTQQEFLSHTWPAEIPFLHLPQVVTLEDGVENEATINGVASQMDLEVSGKTRAVADTPESSETNPSPPSTDTSEDFGFRKEKDLNEMETPEKEEDLGSGDNVEVIDEPSEIPINNSQDPKIAYFQKDDEEPRVTQENTNENITDEPKSSPLAFILSLGAILKIPKLPTPNLNGILGGGMKFKLIGIIVILVIIGIAFSYSYYNFILKADISVFADQKTIDDNLDAKFAVGGGKDAIEIQTIDQEISGDDNKDATGSIETGEKAKGEVTISSSLNSKQTIDAGTVLTAGGLKFTLDSDVEIASSSGVTDIKSAKGKVTASDIGKEYNLPSGTKFAVENYSSSSLEAKNDSAFAGGTKEEKTVVAQSDLDDLLAQITDKLEKDALSKAAESVGSGEEVLANALSSEVVKHEFNHKAKDEADSVSVTATVKYTIGKYNKESLARSVAELSNTKIPDNYAFDDNDSTIDISNLKTNSDGNSASAKLSVNAIFTPKIDSSEISKKIVGKSENFAIEEIKKIDGVGDVNIRFKNALPMFPKIIPNNVSNISIELKKN